MRMKWLRIKKKFYYYIAKRYCYLSYRCLLNVKDYQDYAKEYDAKFSYYKQKEFKLDNLIEKEQKNE